MFWALYQVIFVLGFVALLPRYAVRMLRRGGYADHFAERLGRYTPDVLRRLRDLQHPVWVHAVSVGEMNVAVALIREWRRRDPTARFVISTTTPTGRRLATSKLTDEEVVVYFPVDFPLCVRRALEAIHPSALVLCEGELWPNLTRIAHARGIPIVIVNARLSDRSYRRFRKMRTWTPQWWGRVHLVCVQSSEDCARYIELGVPPDRLLVVGSAKYDAARPALEIAQRLREHLVQRGFPADARFLVGGSTWPGEEEILMRAYMALRSEIPTLRLLLVPRHAERRAELVQRIRARALSLYQRSTDRSDTPTPDVALLDTTGELMAAYGLAEVVFVGKSLTRQGGQNPIEPALWGKPILCGPHMENFRTILNDFVEARAVRIVRNEEDLIQTAREFFHDPALAQQFGQRAREVTEQKSGAIQRTLDALQRVLPTASGSDRTATRTDAPNIPAPGF